jgi:hypothetical protein
MLEILLVVLFFIADQIAESKSVVAGNEIDACIGFSAVVFV